MVLLKFTLFGLNNVTDKNLHSTMVLLKLNTLNEEYRRLAPSTFHYGSIKIRKLEEGKNNVKVATFHYGSIKIL